MWIFPISNKWKPACACMVALMFLTIPGFTHLHINSNSKILTLILILHVITLQTVYYNRLKYLHFQWWNLPYNMAEEVIKTMMAGLHWNIKQDG